MILPDRPFCVIRHGETDANRDGIIAGRMEALLTERGRAAASRLAGLPWPEVALFSSPQIRARETALLAFPGRAPHLLEGLRERDWGPFEGQPVSGQPARDNGVPGCEPWEEVIARVGRAIAAAMAESGGALPVFVAHSGVIRAARVLTGGAGEGPRPPNATPILFSPGPGGWREGTLF